MAVWVERTILAHLTNPARVACLAPVIARVRPFVALLLLALWLPATQHCDLEAAGLLAGHNECHTGQDCSGGHQDDPCAADVCALVEDAAYKSTFAAITIAAPAVLTCLCCLHDITPETILTPLVSPERTDAPPGLASTWRFHTRTALPARAPDFTA